MAALADFDFALFFFAGLRAKIEASGNWIGFVGGLHGPDCFLQIFENFAVRRLAHRAALQHDPAIRFNMDFELFRERHFSNRATLSIAYLDESFACAHRLNGSPLLHATDRLPARPVRLFMTQFITDALHLVASKFLFSIFNKPCLHFAWLNCWIALYRNEESQFFCNFYAKVSF